MQSETIGVVARVVTASSKVATFSSTDRINIGTGIETSVNDLYRMMAAMGGGPDDPVRSSARLGELDRSALDPTRAASELGWRPVTSLDDGLQATLDWFSDR